ncbi:tRNA(fMet)-specific endonuclease VapC [mine drainage metagenome]|uniref:tRNA(fMet)-specific endonuclease VapC n=1 Tax=mine drainage metagenome TaxID=410659 RepID=A0A1J5QHG9_9ZZZZ
MKRYMLDTNTVSHILKQHPVVTRQVIAKPMTSLCISAITEGELLFGLAKRPEARNLHQVVNEFLRRMDVLPWDSATAGDYGSMRAELARKGTPLGSLDMLIAAHAISVDAVLVTSDQAFQQVADLAVEDWTK